MAKAERTGAFQRQFVEDLAYWVREDRKLALRVLDLVSAVLREPFTGVAFRRDTITERVRRSP